MPKTLLAVDDSVTMRKVLEITFSGEDFRVITAENSQSALGKLSENPSILLVDAVLGGEDGYTLAKELRKRSPQAAIILLSSRYTPYDQARGRDAGVDDWADKPFDTQQLIDKVRKVALAKESAPVAVPAAAPTPAVGAPRPAAPPAPAVPSAPTAPTAGNLGRGTQPSLGTSPSRSGTLIFGDGMAMAPPSAPRPVASAPAVPVASAPVAQAPAVAVATATATNGDFAGKLHDLGLTPAQADAVLALSREVVERVVWEVVPQLAETLIKEEIARLTR